MVRQSISSLAIALAVVSVSFPTIAHAVQVPGPQGQESPEPLPLPDELPGVPSVPEVSESSAGKVPVIPAVPSEEETPPDLPPARERPALNDPDVERVNAPQAAAAPGANGLPAFADRLSEGPQDVSVVVDLAGPPSVNLNLETKLVLTVRNQGRNDAHEVVVSDALPSNLEFLDAVPKPDQQEGGMLSWKLGTMPAGIEKTIELRVKAIAPGPVDHVPRVDFSTGAKSRMTILKPELKVEVSSSQTEALKGELVDFNITVINTGDGPARNVVLQAIISKGLRHEGEATTFSQDLGDLGPKQTIGPIPFTVEGIALGEQSCEVSALSADVMPAGQPGSMTKAQVNVVAPELIVDVTGPSTWLKGSVAPYTIKVTNTGTAPALEVRVGAFPPLSGVPRPPADATMARDEQKGVYKIYWEIPRLEPKETKELPLPVRLDLIQNYILNVGANAQGVQEGVPLPTVRDQITTSVEGVADVQIVDVVRTSQVIGIGDETEFMIRLKNMGSQEARQVQVGFLMSDKLKVDATEGTDQPAVTDPANPGRGVFPPIDRIESGGEKTLYIRVSGAGAGIADFRVHVYWDGITEEQAVHHKTFIRVADGVSGGRTIQ